MRDIKFRIFDKRKQKMLVVDTVLLNEKMFKPINGGEYDVFNYDNEYYSELMQYTGVKDKNKKDIYDGDILKSSEKLHSSGNCWIGVIEDNDFGWLALKYKEYINPSWLGALCEPINEPQTASWIMATCEVIGNRYENPELLEEVQ